MDSSANNIRKKLLHQFQYGYNGDCTSEIVVQYKADLAKKKTQMEKQENRGSDDGLERFGHLYVATFVCDRLF